MLNIVIESTSAPVTVTAATASSRNEPEPMLIDLSFDDDDDDANAPSAGLDTVRATIARRQKTQNSDPTSVVEISTDGAPLTARSTDGAQVTARLIDSASAAARLRSPGFFSWPSLSTPQDQDATHFSSPSSRHRRYSGDVTDAAAVGRRQRRRSSDDVLFVDYERGSGSIGGAVGGVTQEESDAAMARRVQVRHRQQN